MKLYITSDHGGFALKQKILEYLRDRQFDAEDIGPFEFNPDDDYPVFAHELADKVAENPGEARGIIVCRSATGVSIATNRHAGIRAAIAWNETVARHSREHNDSNILCLSGDYVSEDENLAIALAWLKEPFSQEQRHERRIKMIDEMV